MEAVVMGTGEVKGNRLVGLIVPLLTPFNEAGEVDLRAFEDHLAFLADQGVERIMVNGTTAEFYSLLPEERKALFVQARNSFSGQLVLHAGGGSLLQNLEEVRWANEYGADAVAVLPPFYPSSLPEQGMVDYLSRLASEAEVPFILYNFPTHTGNPLTASILKQVPHAALKDSGQQLDLIDATPRYFVGSSSRVMPAIEAGAVGFVSATANVRPALYADLALAIASGDLAHAYRLQDEIKRFSAPFSRGGVPLLKQVLAGKVSGYPIRVRCPL
jgi:dihydrodipicolinate synthase/N-acetylneuraminate lyase